MTGTHRVHLVCVVLAAGIGIALLLGAAVPDPRKLPGVSITIQGEIDSVVLVDPMGRANRSEGDPGIPDCTRWDGGTLSDSDDSTSVDTGSRIAVKFELDRVIAGRYRLYATSTKRDTPTVTVNLRPEWGSEVECPELTSEPALLPGRHRWNIEITPTLAKSRCPVRLVNVVAGTSRPRPK